MTHDIVIRGGTIVDGTGAEPIAADIAISGGRIAAIGMVADGGAEEIDAAGCIVTPGFVDAHTHFDAQVGWDRKLAPSLYHGVTTALLGNCGMTFAPVRPGGAQALADMMETVEDIPADAILQTLPWSWESYGDYLDFVETQAPAINVVGLLGHSALRYYVMGDRAVDGEPTEADVAEMAAIVGKALDDGAAGFSTSRFLGHKLKDGRYVPGTYAPREELLAIAGAMKGRGLFQGVLNSIAMEADMALITDVGAATGGPVLVTAVAVEPPREGHKGPEFKQPTPAMIEAARAQGADVTATLLPRDGGSLYGLLTKLPWKTPAWDALAKLGHADRLAAIRDPKTRAALIAEADAADPPPHRIFVIGRGPARYMLGREDSLATVAAAAGETPATTFLRLSEEHDGRMMFAYPTFNRNPQRIRDLLASPHMLPGLGDAGAHLSSTMDASYTTFVLGHWVRDTGVLTLPEAVRRLTSAPADLIGLEGRGRLREGAVADINVIDLDRLTSLEVEPAYDAPLGTPRLIQHAEGYRATLVGGVPLIRDDAHTGAYPGTVIRSFARH